MVETCLKIILAATTDTCIIGQRNRTTQMQFVRANGCIATAEGLRDGRHPARDVLVLVADFSIRTTTRPEFDGKLGLHLVYLARISSKNASARVSFDWPSQNMASLRTNGFLLFRAT